MITIREFLNKIKWDNRENPEDYSIVFIDLGKEKEILYKDIQKIEGNWMTLFNDKGEEVEVPLHRVRKVKKKGNIVWER